MKAIKLVHEFAKNHAVKVELTGELDQNMFCVGTSCSKCTVIEHCFCSSESMFLTVEEVESLQNVYPEAFI